MSFFKKKRPALSFKKESTKINGVSKQISTEDCSPSCNKLPLLNFEPPPDLISDVLTKSHWKKTSTVEELLSWARDHFSAFLKNEEAENILLLWERVSTVLDKKRIATTSICKDENCGELIALKSQIEESTVYTNFKAEENSNSYNNLGSWFTEVQKFLSKLLLEQYLPKFLESPYFIKCQIDMLTNGQSISLHDILHSQNALFYFMEYVDQEDKREVLEFWLGANNFAEHFLVDDEDIDLKVAQSDAMVLYEKYISLQAPQPLGFRDETRSEVERLICSKNVAHCFDRPRVEAFAYLRVTCLDGFLKSSLFYSFLNDLLRSLSSAEKSSQGLGNLNSTDSNSTCSNASTKSYSPPCNSRRSSILHRRHKNKLSMGRVNSLGKFEADTDLELIKQESGITKTMKKLVNFDEKEKEKEELAWQVAAMIINEVTSITMGTSESKDSINQSSST